MSPLADLNALPFPDFEEFKPEDYLNFRRLPTYFSRGCPRRCAFCDVGAAWGAWRNRNGERVFSEIMHAGTHHPYVNSFVFSDPLVNADLNELGKFCDLMVEARERSGKEIRWGGYAVVRTGMTPAFFQKMRAAGCEMLMFGVESGSQKVLDSMRKGQQVSTAEQVLRDCRAAGIMTTAFFLAGFPTETFEDFCESVAFIGRNAPFMTEVSCRLVKIGDGTPLAKEAVRTYGVNPRNFHCEYWESQEGKNNYLERLRRFEVLCEHAARHGVEHVALGAVFKRRRNRMVEEYQSFRKSGGVGEPSKAVFPTVFYNW